MLTNWQFLPDRNIKIIVTLHDSESPITWRTTYRTETKFPYGLAVLDNPS